MRRFDKLNNIRKANLLSEQRYLQSKQILTEDAQKDALKDVLKGMKGKIWNIIKDYYSETKDYDYDDDYSRLNIFRNGDDETERLDVLDEEGYYDFPRFKNQIKNLIADETIDKIEIQYGNESKGQLDYLILYEK